MDPRATPAPSSVGMVARFALVLSSPGDSREFTDECDWESFVSLIEKVTSSTAEFLNKRGVYAGRRSTKIHVALYRRTGGRVGGALPGLPRARIALLDH